MSCVDITNSVMDFSGLTHIIVKEQARVTASKRKQVLTGGGRSTSFGLAGFAT